MRSWKKKRMTMGLDELFGENKSVPFPSPCPEPIRGGGSGLSFRIPGLLESLNSNEQAMLGGVLGGFDPRSLGVL
jgi:hypothetical protein